MGRESTGHLWQHGERRMSRQKSEVGSQRSEVRRDPATGIFLCIGMIMLAGGIALASIDVGSQRSEVRRDPATGIFLAIGMIMLAGGIALASIDHAEVVAQGEAIKVLQAHHHQHETQLGGLVELAKTRILDLNERVKKLEAAQPKGGRP